MQESWIHKKRFKRVDHSKNAVRENRETAKRKIQSSKHHLKFSDEQTYSFVRKLERIRDVTKVEKQILERFTQKHKYHSETTN